MIRPQLEYDVMEFIIHNKKDIRDMIKGPVMKYWRNEEFFPAPFQREFRASVTACIVECVQDFVMNVMKLNPEECLALVTEQVLRDLTDDFFFERGNYA